MTMLQALRLPGCGVYGAASTVYQGPAGGGSVEVVREPRPLSARAAAAATRATAARAAARRAMGARISSERGRGRRTTLGRARRSRREGRRQRLRTRAG